VSGTTSSRDGTTIEPTYQVEDFTPRRQLAAEAARYRWRMSSPVDPDSLRISAAERDAAVAAIGEHLTAGRLELDEYERRVNAATQARTYADLRPLFVDLPQPHPPPPLTAHTGPGHLPAEVRDQLTAEGLRVLTEDLAGSMIYRRYRAPGQRIYRRTIGIRGAIAVSQRRLLVWAAGAKRVDVPFVHPLWHAVEVSVDHRDRLRISIDVGAFNPDRSGRIAWRLQTREAPTIAGMLATTR